MYRTLNLLSTCRQDLTKQITKWGLGDAGFNYDLVAVFGSQSTGKSELRYATIFTRAWFADRIFGIGTLLNRLFGTDFDVMSETRRQQTTKGE